MAYSNTFASQTNGTAITAASTANDGTQLQTTAGTQTIPITGDPHMGRSMHVGAVAATQSRPIVLPLSNTATSVAASIEFVIAGAATGVGGKIAIVEANGGGTPAAMIITTAGTVMLARNAGATMKTSTTVLKPFTPYRLDVAVAGLGSTAGSVHMAVCPLGAAPFAAVSADLDASASGLDFTSTGYQTLKSVQFGYIAGQDGTFNGTFPDTWWAAPRADEGASTPVVNWRPAAAIGTTVRPTLVEVVTGSATASGTRTGESAAINSADLSGTSDGDANTVLNTAAGTTVRYTRHIKQVASGDVTVNPVGASGISQVELFIDGTSKGAKAYSGSALVWTRAEQGNLTANTEHTFSVVLS